MKQQKAPLQRGRSHRSLGRRNIVISPHSTQRFRGPKELVDSFQVIYYHGGRNDLLRGSIREFGDRSRSGGSSKSIQRFPPSHLAAHYRVRCRGALAAKTCIRSVWGAGVVLFTQTIDEAVGIQWASPFSAFLALLCPLVSSVFHFKGPTIRKYSRYAFLDESTRRRWVVPHMSEQQRAVIVP